jgi:hypothetical protein
MINLEARSKTRASLVKEAKGSIIDRCKSLYINLFRSKLEHVKDGEHIPSDVPVGKKKFEDWCKSIFENFYGKEMQEVLSNPEATKTFVYQIADAIGKSPTEILNPIRDYNPIKDQIFQRGTSTASQVFVKVKRAQVEAQDSKNIYSTPTEHSRYCPDHPGSMMRRVSDNVYQCPINGDLNQVEPWKDKFSYTDGHEVSFETGVQNQTHAGWNDLYPLKPFFSERAESDVLKFKGKPYGFEREDLYGVQNHWDGIPPKVRQDEKLAKTFFDKITKSAQYNEAFFGPTTMPTRQCPDHPGQQMARVSDNVKQCMLDGKVYDFEQGFKTEDGVMHPGGSVQAQNSLPPGAVIIKQKKASLGVADSPAVHGFLWNIVQYLPADSKERQILNNKFQKNISLEDSMAQIKSAEEFQKQEKATASTIKSFLK